MLPLLKVIIPDILDYHLPKFGTFHNCVFIKMKPEYPDVKVWTTFDSTGHLVIQKQKNGATVTKTTEDTLRSIWQPRNLW